MSAYIGRFVFNGLAHPKYAIIRGIGVRCDLPEVIETGFGDVHPPPKFKIEKEKRGFSFFLFLGVGWREECGKTRSGAGA